MGKLVPEEPPAGCSLSPGSPYGFVHAEGGCTERVRAAPENDRAPSQQPSPKLGPYRPKGSRDLSVLGASFLFFSYNK
eukprot:1060184-Rhodomonas_salina.1